jgi:flagellar hook-basal body complex protein FliE
VEIRQVPAQENAMAINAIESVLAQIRAASAVAAGKAPSAPQAAGASTGFGAALKSAVDEVNASQQEARRLARDYELGAPGADLQDAMVAVQKANISFQAMVQVRNRLVSAYQDIMNMQI